VNIRCSRDISGVPFATAGAWSPASRPRARCAPSEAESRPQPGPRTTVSGSPYVRSTKRDYDYYIRIAVKDTRDYERLLRERLYRIPGIRHSKSSFVLRTLKESLIPLASAPVEAGSQPRKARNARTAGRRAAKRLP